MTLSFSFLRPAAALAAALALLAGCGGGGGGGAPGVPPGGSARYAEDPEDPASCTVARQKNFVRAYLDEVYLWYDEIVNVDPNEYRTVSSYFNALLVRTPDATGQPKDRFSAAIPASQAVNPGALGLLHDGGLADVVKDHGGSNPVPIHRVQTSTGGREVGYVLFNDHDTGAQDHLINAFRDLQAGNVQDLVLDLRNNAGGYLYIALSAASMIAGPSSEGKVFERLRYNDKRQSLTDSSVLRFSSRAQFGERDYPAGTALPQLDLPRVFVLTSDRTCSASESIINALRGIDVQVIRIGDTTCGKPYGFTRKDNCGIAYFPIEFQGTNAKDFGDYQAGFQPICRVEDTGAAPGSASDALMNAALHYIDNDACPAGTATNAQMTSAPKIATQEPSRRFTGRLLLPQQQPAR